MSDMQNFIEIPRKPLKLMELINFSLKTAQRFFADQKWTSLAFLFIYLLLMVWDYHSVQLLPAPAEPDWLQNWHEFLAPLREQIARQSLGTWRSLLASFLTLLYWGNALLYIADRSSGFSNQAVVGLVRYLLRGSGITIVLFVPLMIGTALLIVPGVFIAGVLIAAATIAMFREKSIFLAIHAGYRLVTTSLPGQERILGFSRSFIHIVAAYGLVMIASAIFASLTIFVSAGLAHFLGHPTAFGYGHQVLSNLVTSFLNMLFSIVVLRIYAESLTLTDRSGS